LAFFFLKGRIFGNILLEKKFRSKF
jgi:hypothetical protein